jgi:ADP-dependent NAD(P)H-hydrate dehydratase / NAD(P)H-hydrate epimerase
VRPVLTAAEMRAADEAALADVSHETLVTRAGTATAVAALRILGGAYGRRVTVIAGKGSNGADARVAAAHLARRGVRVTVFDAVAVPPALAQCDLVIDGAYGTGFRGEYDAPVVPAGTPVLAVDLPSGLNADSGAASGRATCATHTVTFAAYKPGLLQGDGPELSGRITVVDIGISVGGHKAALVEDSDLPAQLSARPRQSHKWSTALGVAAGSIGMEGAAVLCTRGAMAAGAGMIRLGTPGDPTGPWPVEAVRASLTTQRWAGAFMAATAKCRALVIGPGLGTADGTTQEIQSVIASSTLPLVIDADALTALRDLATARFLLVLRTAPTVLTPHDGEYARLTGAPPGADRLAAARHLASELGVIVLLKGPLTAIAAPDGSGPDVLLSTSGVPALATAGSGDVLSGIIGAFLARGVPAHQAAALAAHAHGRAASRGRPQGLVSGQLPDLVAAYLSEVGADA